MLLSCVKVANLLVKQRQVNGVMSTFVSRTNPVTGKLDWIVQNEDYDFQQEVARSAYADMLHDTERNKKYYKALNAAIAGLHARGKKAHVLDIGTGTGLLSMMASRLGADTVTACEAFQPVADCAGQVIKDNGFDGRIKLIAKRSTDVTVGPNGDMEERANVLVTEVFDTELIGEGALGTFQHALEHLLQSDSVVIPSAATVYAQVVTSSFFRRCNTFEPLRLPNGKCIVPPEDVAKCSGTAAVHDLQLGQVTLDMFTALSPPIPVFRFDFSGKLPLTLHRHVENTVEAVAHGRCDAVFMWWELEMESNAQLTLSTAPYWAHPTPSDIQWRDHWMQAVYYPASDLTVSTSQCFTLHSFHDEYSLWFDVSHHNSEVASTSPACVCGAHLACCRTRIGMMNDSDRNNAYIAALSSVVKANTVCLCLSDACLLPFIVASLGAAMVYTVESNVLCRRLVDSYVAANGLRSSIIVLDKSAADLTAADIDYNQITLLVGEPFFISSALPWHNLHFLYARTQLRELLANDCCIMPGAVSVKAIAVEFEHLYKIRSAIGDCEGFNMSAFDRLIAAASGIADAYAEPHPLWEYPARPLSATFDLLHVNLGKSLHGIKSLERSGSVELTSRGELNGVAMWLECRLSAGHSVTSGLLPAPSAGQLLQWDRHSRQAVHLLSTPVVVQPGERGQRWILRYRTVFMPHSGDVDLQFTVVPASES